MDSDDLYRQYLELNGHTEDESGWLNLIVWRDLAERQRRVLLDSQLVGVQGELQKADGVTHVLARRLENLTGLLGGLDARSRDFH